MHTIDIALIGYEPPGSENLSLRLLAATVDAAGHRAAVLPITDIDRAAKMIADAVRLAPRAIGLSLQDPEHALHSLALAGLARRRGFDGYIVRPLSAQRLPETIPERRGWVERAGLLGIAGRGRKEQIRLAREFGVTDYPAPAGGCLLTDKNYSRRLRDLLAHRDLPFERELELLKYGRHFRLDPDTKVVVGRTQAENEAILTCCDPAVDVRIKTRDYPGPLALVPHGGKPAAVMLAATICAGYSKAPKMVQAVAADVVRPGGREVLQVIALPPADFKRLLI